MQISYETFIAIIKPSGLHSVGLHAIPAVHRKTVQFSNSIATNSPVARPVQKTAIRASYM